MPRMASLGQKLPVRNIRAMSACHQSVPSTGLSADAPNPAVSLAIEGGHVLLQGPTQSGEFTGSRAGRLQGIVVRG